MCWIKFKFLEKIIIKVFTKIILYDIVSKELSFESIQNFSGDYDMEVIPVPIPNTEVKLQCANNICGLPCWEDRLSPDFIYSSLAQLVERSAVNR